MSFFCCFTKARHHLSWVFFGVFFFKPRLEDKAGKMQQYVVSKRITFQTILPKRVNDLGSNTIVDPFITMTLLLGVRGRRWGCKLTRKESVEMREANGDGSAENRNGEE